MEITPMMLRHTAVQYRLADDENTREPRWRSAQVIRQRDGGALDLAVNLASADPEYRERLAKCAGFVQYRCEDRGGEQQWRTALVADRPHPDGSLDLTVHLTLEDQKLQGKAFQRIAGATYGDGVGQYRESGLTYPVTLLVQGASRGSEIGMWLPGS